MGDNRNPFLRTLAEQPGGEDDGGQDRLQVARRQVDDNPPFASLGHFTQDGDEVLDVFAVVKWLAWVEVTKRAFQKSAEVFGERIF